MIETNSSDIPRAICTGEAQHTLPREVSLGAHHLLLKSDQSIELMRSRHDHTQPEYVLCLDAIETYRLLMALHEAFGQTSIP